MIPSCAGAVLSTIAAVLVPQRDIMLGPVKTDTFFALICFALALWGIAQGAGSSALEALLADSVPTGLLGLRWVPLVLRCRLLCGWGCQGCMEQANALRLGRWQGLQACWQLQLAGQLHWLVWDASDPRQTQLVCPLGGRGALASVGRCSPSTTCSIL